MQRSRFSAWIVLGLIGLGVVLWWSWPPPSGDSVGPDSEPHSEPVDARSPEPVEPIETRGVAWPGLGPADIEAVEPPPTPRPEAREADLSDRSLAQLVAEFEANSDRPASDQNELARLATAIGLAWAGCRRFEASTDPAADPDRGVEDYWIDQLARLDEPEVLERRVQELVETQARVQAYEQGQRRRCEGAETVPLDQRARLALDWLARAADLGSLRARYRYSQLAFVIGDLRWGNAREVAAVKQRVRRFMAELLAANYADGLLLMAQFADEGYFEPPNPVTSLAYHHALLYALDGRSQRPWVFEDTAYSDYIADRMAAGLAQRMAALSPEQQARVESLARSIARPQLVPGR